MGDGTVGPHATAKQWLTYDGRLSELYVIFLKNVLLSILTLGIYRFWGRTNIRRYLWSRFSMFGDRFEYTGTGRELFLGFLVVLVVLLALGGATFGVAYLLGDRHPGVGFVLIIAFYLLLFYLLFVGQFTALRYRMTRTRWRGIRGAMGGSPWKYGLIGMFWTVLNGFAAGLLGPVVVMQTMGYRLNNAYYGTAKARFDGGPGDVYGRFIGFYFGSILCVLLAVGLCLGVAAGFGAFDGVFDELSAMADKGAGRIETMRAAHLQLVLVGTIYGCIIVGALAVLPISCWYLAYLYNYLVASTGIAGLGFAGCITTRSMFGFYFVNLLIMLFTLGLGFPWVLHRVAVFVSANVAVAGTIDPATIAQSQMAMPSRGEGLLDLLDPGVI